jgi:hypothetical protein
MDLEQNKTEQKNDRKDGIWKEVRRDFWGGVDNRFKRV